MPLVSSEGNALVDGESGRKSSRVLLAKAREHLTASGKYLE